MAKTAQIALPIPSKQFFTYLIPEEIGENDLIGRRALVPFGKRTLTGVIIETAESDDTGKLKPIHELLDVKPSFSTKHLGFIRWIADYYYSSPGEILRSALPQGMSPQSVLKIHIIKEITGDDIKKISKRAPKRAELLQKLSGHSGYLTVKFLEKELKSENIAAQLTNLEQQGFIEIERIVEKDIRSKKQKAVALTEELMNDEEKLKEIFDELDEKAHKQSMLLSHIYLYEKLNSAPALVSDALREMQASMSALNALKEKGYARIMEVEVDRARREPLGESLAPKDEISFELTDEQTAARDTIFEALTAAKFKPFLLFGVTGSGKTLLYMHAARKALNEGKNVLILVPEISLTPQLIDRFERVFGSETALYHSRMSEGERFDTWRNIREGKSRIVLGARSAIFVPLENIGLIIVDEEHEFSYKQEKGQPGYHARDCAVVRGKMEDAVVVLGSSTPSIESMYNVESGKYELLELTKRADDAEAPPIEVIDMLNARKKGRTAGNYSIDLLNDIKDRIEKEEGTIIFQNRRGFSSYLECPDCGHVPMCTNCDVTLTFHKKVNQLRCHYCGYTIPAFKACRVCGYPEMKEKGSGTQRVEDELSDRLLQDDVEADVVRMDLDTTRRKGAMRRILKDFASGKTDIIVGTQMVSKGLDFERVTLVGVLNADLHLFLPDFRSAERTYQIINQVAGRAGRSRDKKSKVIVQTSHPEHPAIVTAVRNTYNEFYREELKTRRDAFYPPYSRFVVIEFSGKDEKKTETQSRHFASFLPMKNKVMERLGPVPPFIARLKTYYRRIIIIKNNKTADASGRILRKHLDRAFDEYGKKYSTSAVRIKVDIDAYGAV